MMTSARVVKALLSRAALPATQRLVVPNQSEMKMVQMPVRGFAPKKKGKGKKDAEEIVFDGHGMEEAAPKKKRASRAKKNAASAGETTDSEVPVAEEVVEAPVVAAEE